MIVPSSVERMVRRQVSEYKWIPSTRAVYALGAIVLARIRLSILKPWLTACLSPIIHGVLHTSPLHLEILLILFDVLLTYLGQDHGGLSLLTSFRLFFD